MSVLFTSPSTRWWLTGRLFLLLLLVAHLGYGQTIRYVKAGATGDGSSWTKATGELQTMINASRNGDQVWVAGGRYDGASYKMKNGVAIYGGFSGTESSLQARPSVSPVNGSPSSTTLTIADPASAAAVVANTDAPINDSDDVLDNSARLDGFVIWGGPNSIGIINQDGNNPSIVNCLISNNGRGGMFNRQTFSIRILNCLIENNVTNNENGGGITFFLASPQVATTPTMDNCVIRFNSARLYGGGIYIAGFEYLDTEALTLILLKLSNCLINNNSASFGGGFTLESLPQLTPLV